MACPTEIQCKPLSNYKFSTGHIKNIKKKTYEIILTAHFMMLYILNLISTCYQNRCDFFYKYILSLSCSLLTKS